MYLSRYRMRFCSGLVEWNMQEVLPPSYVWALAEAEKVIGSDFANEQEREKLVWAVKLNLVNQKENPYEWLRRRYGLCVGKNRFTRERQLYCQEIVRLLIKEDKS